MTKLFILLIVFQIKHFLADFPLQNNYMLGKFKEKGWQLPLACHAGVHALFSGVIGYFAGATVAVYVSIALLDFVIHFAMDRVKASPKLLGKYACLSKRDFERSNTYTACKLSDKDFKENKYFWWSLGLDQMVHHLTHYVLIWILL